MLGKSKAVSRKFNFMSSQKIRDLKQVKLKARTASKVNWAVTAYNDWRFMRLENGYNESIFNANLSNLADLDEASLCESLCHFIPEVSKSKGEELYPAKTLYQLIVTIQKHLNVNKIAWKLIDGAAFENVKIMLDNVMKEHTELNVGTVKKQAELITYAQENLLWKEGHLGEQNPDQLRVPENGYNESIFNANLSNLADLDEASLCESLCHFIPEVSKSKGEELYPVKTLYQLIVTIQKHLNVNKIAWKLIDGAAFENVKIMLDNVMKEHTELNVGPVKKQAELITYAQENLLWKEGHLGEQNPDQLRETVLYLLGVNLALRAGDEHYLLRREIPGKASQLSFEHNTDGVRCLVYREDTCTKTNDGGI